MLDLSHGINLSIAWLALKLTLMRILGVGGYGFQAMF